MEVRADHMIPRTGLALADRALPFLHSHTPAMVVKGKIAFIVKAHGLKDAGEMEKRIGRQRVNVSAKNRICNVFAILCSERGCGKPV